MALLQASPPELTAADVHNQIAVCVGAMDGLSSPIQPDQVWNLTYDWQVFFDDSGRFSQPFFVQEGTDGGWAQFPGTEPGVGDVGYGPQLPTNNPLTPGTPVGPGTNVFAYTFALPAYLTAVTIFLAAGLALDPQFIENWSDVIQSAADFLKGRHDFIQSGIQPFSPGPWTTANLATQQYLGTAEGLLYLGSPSLTKGIRTWYTLQPPWQGPKGALATILPDGRPTNTGTWFLEASSSTGPLNVILVIATSTTTTLWPIRIALRTLTRAH